MIRHIDITVKDGHDKGQWFVDAQVHSRKGISGVVQPIIESARITGLGTQQITNGFRNTDVGRTVVNVVRVAEIAELIVAKSKLERNIKANEADLSRRGLIRASQSRVAGGTSITDGRLPAKDMNASYNGSHYKRWLFVPTNPANNKLCKLIATTNYDDPDSVERLGRAIRHYGRTHGIDELQGLKGGSSFNFKNASEAENAVAFAMSLNSKADLGAQLKHLEKKVKLFAKDNNIEKRLQHHILGRIATGEIDVDKIIASGKLCGKDIDEELEMTLLALKSYANVKSIAFETQTATLSAAMGFEKWRMDDNQKLIGQIQKEINKGNVVMPKGYNSVLKFDSANPLGTNLNALSAQQIMSLDVKAMTDNISDPRQKKLTQKLIKKLKGNVGNASMSMSPLHNNNTLSIAKHLDRDVKNGNIIIPARLAGKSFKDMTIQELKSIKPTMFANPSSLKTRARLADIKTMTSVLENRLHQTELDLAELSKPIKLNDYSMRGIARIDDRIKISERNLNRAHIPGVSKKGIGSMSNDKLAKLLKRKDVSNEQKEAIRDLIKMRNQKNLLQAKRATNSQLRNKIGFYVLKVTGIGRSDIVQGLNKVRQMKRGVSLALKIGRGVGRFVYRPFKPIVRFATKGVRVKFENATLWLKNHARALKNEVRTQVKLATNKANDAAKNAAKKAADKVVSKMAPGAQKVIKKGAEGLSKANKTRKAAIAKHKAKKAIKTTKHTGIFAPIKAVKGFLMKAGIIAALVFLIGISAGTAMEAMIEPLASFDEWLCSLKWPWEATDEEKENALLSTLETILELEKETGSADYWLEQLKAGGKMYYYFVDPKTNKVNKIDFTSADGSAIVKDNTYFRFYEQNEEEGNEIILPVNDYSVAKLTLAMSHAFTLPLSMDSDLKVFAKYAVGLWNYLYSHKLELHMVITPDSVSTLNYYCNEYIAKDNYRPGSEEKSKNPNFNDKLYSYCILDSDYTIGSEIAVDPTASGLLMIGSGSGSFYYQDSYDAKSTDKLLLVDSHLQEKSVVGCLKTMYNAKNGTKTTYLTSNMQKVSTENTEIGQLSDFVTTTSKSGLYKLMNDDNITGNPLSKYIVTNKKNGTVISYKANPTVAKECAEHEFKELFSTNNVDTAKKILNNTTINYCSNLSILNGSCNNHTTLYCDGCISGNKTYHGISISFSDGTSLNHVIVSNNSDCDNKGNVMLYTCSGHEKTNYHGSTVKDKDGIYFMFASKYKCCENSFPQKITTPDGKTSTYYICHGYTVKEYCGGGLLMQTPCTNCKSQPYFVCKGHAGVYCPGHEVCLGHFTESDCTGHYHCDGHTLKYSIGSPKYELITTIIGSGDKEALFKDWEYSVYTKKKILWWTADAHVNYKSSDLVEELSKDASIKETGWNDDKVMEVFALLDKDWYDEYGISSTSFKGGQFGEGEIRNVLKSAGITQDNISLERYNTILAAFEAIGRIPYYPDGHASNATLEGNSFGAQTGLPPVTEGRYEYSTIGLGKKWFADYCVWTGSDNGNGIYTRSHILRPLKMYQGNQTVYKSIIDNESNAQNYPLLSTKNYTPGDVIAKYENGVLTQTYILIGQYKGRHATNMFMMISMEPSDISGWAVLNNVNVSNGLSANTTFRIITDAYRN